ncbi:MAG TPA: hypothetical protein VFB06_34420 [Streptosporangiaceae bacterium]|nr:hypothetical protein [Streptosporangiaceae bacterium]
MDELTTEQRLERIEGHLLAIRVVFERLVPVLDLIEPLLPIARSKLGRTVLTGYLAKGPKS